MNGRWFRATVVGLLVVAAGVAVLNWRARTEIGLETNAEVAFKSTGLAGAEVVVTETSPAGREPSRLSADSLVTLSGRVVDPDDAPVSGAAVEVRMSESNPEAEPVKAMTGEDGAFKVAIQTTGKQELDICVKAPSFAAESWHFDLTEVAGTVVESGRFDLGVFELMRAGVVHGRLVNSRGGPTQHAYSVSGVITSLGDRDSHRSFLDSKTLTQANHGEFRLENVPFGLCQLEVSDARGNAIHTEVVVVNSGDRAILTIAIDEPRQGSFVVNLDSSGSHPEWRVDSRYVHLTSSDGRVWEPDETSLYGLAFRDVGPGPYRLLIDDPAFRRAEFEALEPYEGRIWLDGAVAGPCAMRLDVRDEANHPILTNYSVTVRRISSQESVPRWREVDGIKTRDTPFLIENLPSAGLSVQIDCGGFNVKTVDFAPLTHGETRTVTVILDRDRSVDETGTLVGRYLDPWDQGTHARTRVTLLRAPSDFAISPGTDIGCQTEGVDSYLTPQGELFFTNIPPGEYFLRIRRQGTRQVASSVFTIRAGEETNIGNVTLPRGREVRGRLTLPEDARRWTAEVHAYSTLECPVVKGCNKHSAMSRATLAPDGSFAFSDLGPGKHRVYYVPSRTRSRSTLANLWVPAIFVGSFDVKDSDIDTLLLNARDGFMGRLEILFRAEGSPMTFSRVRIVQTGEHRYVEHALTDGNGRVRLDLIPLGDFQLDVDDRENGCTYRVPGLRSSTTDRRLETIDVPVANCCVSVQGRDGTLVRSQEVSFWGGFGAEPWVYSSARRSTGVDGTLTIRLPVAAGSFTIEGRDGTGEIHFDTAPPAVFTVQLRSEKK